MQLQKLKFHKDLLLYGRETGVTDVADRPQLLEVSLHTIL